MSEIYDLIVIGGGSAGLVAASGAAILGAKVALIEKNALGGDCLYTGCVPSKTMIKSARFMRQAREAEKFGFQPLEPKFLDNSFAAITNRINRVIKTIEHQDAPERFEKMGVEVVFGAPRFLNPQTIEVTLKDKNEQRVMRARRFCLATGSSPLVPPIENLAATGFITNEEVFRLEKLPARLLVIGAGAIGIELGQSFARFGAEVTIIEAGSRILTKEDEEVSALMEDVLRREKVGILTNAKVVKAAKAANGAKILTVEKDDKTFDLETDEILVAVGRKPNTDELELKNAAVEFDQKSVATDEYLRTSQKHIFAAGDITNHYQFTHSADYEARIVVQNAFAPFFLRKKTDFHAVPWATFAEPEIGRVGLTEAEARKKYAAAAVKIYKIPFSENDRAQTDGATDGFAKVVTYRKRVVGATLVGERAGELIHEFVWAMTENLKITDLNKIIRVYPTLAKITQAIATQATLETLQSPFTQKWFGRYLRWWR